jgi:hypothetical protein
MFLDQKTHNRQKFVLILALTYLFNGDVTVNLIVLPRFALTTLRQLLRRLCVTSGLSKDRENGRPVHANVLTHF